jgi:hypothetical protein
MSWKETFANFLQYDKGNIEDNASNYSSISTFVFTAAETFLSRLSLAKIVTHGLMRKTYEVGHIDRLICNDTGCGRKSFTISARRS